MYLTELKGEQDPWSEWGPWVDTVTGRIGSRNRVDYVSLPEGEGRREVGGRSVDLS